MLIYRNTIPSYIYYAELPKDNESGQIEVEYQIEQILDHRIKEKEKDSKQAVQTIEREVPLEEAKEDEVQYLVKWMGFEELTWEPAQNLKNAPDVLESYRQEHFHNSNMIGRKTKVQGKKGKKRDVSGNPLNTASNKGKKGARPKVFDINKVFPKPNVKTEFDEDELVIINKETYQEAVGESKSKVGKEAEQRVESKHEEEGNIFENLFTFQIDIQDVPKDQNQLKENQLLKDHNNQKDLPENLPRQALQLDQNDQDNRMPDDYCNQFRNPLSYTSNHNSPQENNQPLNISAQSPEEHSEIRTMSKDLSIRPLFPLEYIENIESHEHVPSSDKKEDRKRSKKEMEPDLAKYDSACKMSKLHEFIERKSMLGKRKRKEIAVIEIESDTEYKIGSYLI